MKTSYPVAERNELLLHTFTSNGFDAQLVGNPNQPAVVIDGTYAIAGYVHNKLYHFCDKPFGGSEIHSVHLTENPSISRTKILELINISEPRKLHKIQVDFGAHALWFNNHRNDNFYFSDNDVRYFFSYAKATEALELLMLNRYDAQLVSPEYMK